MKPHPYETVGGILAEEGIKVLQKFYDRGNEAIPLEKRNRFKKIKKLEARSGEENNCLLYTSPSPRDKRQSRMPSSA